MQITELRSHALNWAVATAEGYTKDNYMRNANIVTDVNGKVVGIQVPKNYNYIFYSPATNWEQGGAIIQHNEINLAKVGRSLEDAIAPHPECWAAHIDGSYVQYGNTPLIAAMRCFVRYKWNSTNIDLPKVLS